MKKNLHNQNDIYINKEKKDSDNNISAGDGSVKINNYPLYSYNTNNFKKESKFKLYNKK